MSAAPLSEKLFAREQFRMTRLQVFNWGTFTDLHDVPISERGFLIVGRSGAGKSTLLDAFSAMLVQPRWIDFNAAAREADRTGRDRNLVTYVRGAWAAQSDTESGETATRYLRTGTTWSAIALHYRNALGQDVVLVQLFWLRGNANGNNDVKRYYLVFERPFDLREAADFGDQNFDVRKLKQRFPEAYARDEFRPYCDRFCRLLGIENDMALRLLHKTQSAKNLGDLNTFLRDFMLDRPETFEVADRLVNEFGELNGAHQAVMTAREQVQLLAPARARHQQMHALRQQRAALEELRAGMNSYREQRRIELLKAALAKLEVEAEGLAGQLQREQNTVDNRSAILRDLQQQRRLAGGDMLEAWESEKRGLEEQRRERMRRRQQAVSACAKLDWVFPATPQGFALLLGEARSVIEAFAEASDDDLLLLDRRKEELSKRHTDTLREVASLRRQPSNIPAALVELRRDIATSLGVAESALPFVGELLEIKADEAEWRGAAERVLRGFALSILVDEAHYNALAAHVNAVHLGQRLVYIRASKSATPLTRPLPPSSLVFKIDIKPGTHAGWLQAELRQRFDYECVDSIRAFRTATDRAVTREGQVKHSKTRHEKDDRSAIDARRNWVLGFDNREKLALFEQQSRELAGALDVVQRELDAIRKNKQQAAERVLECKTLANLQWSEVDAQPVVERIAAIERNLATARSGNSELLRIDAMLKQQEQLVKEASDKRDEKATDHKACLRESANLQSQLDNTLSDPTLVPLTPFQQSGLDERYASHTPIRLDQLDHVDRSVGRKLGTDIDGLTVSITECEKAIESVFASFLVKWRGDAEGLDATLAASADFFSKLARLETDGLPAHEQRFRDLLQNQSNQNLAALSSYLSQGRKAILERMELVNESLRQVPFNQSLDQLTYLHIEPSDRQLPEVREFRQEIKAILSQAWDDDAEAAEQRFIGLRRLVDKLASVEPDHRRWREAVLDVRTHVEFVGREIDTEGHEVEVYRSGAGKSGGQRQKLATTCLAAALRYQLGGSDHGVPMYAPVVLDEAFDKADNEFTALAMNIFTNFGFQMIVATPLKSVMTLEPFIGGACFVDIRERRVSGVLMIEYDADRQRLMLPDQSRAEYSLEASS